MRMSMCHTSIQWWRQVMPNASTRSLEHERWLSNQRNCWQLCKYRWALAATMVTYVLWAYDMYTLRNMAKCKGGAGASLFSQLHYDGSYAETCYNSEIGRNASLDPANTARCNSSLIKVKADMRSSTLFNNDARDTFQWFSGMQNCSPASAGIVAYAPCPPVNTMLLDTQSWLKGVKAGWKRQHLLQTSDNSQDVPAMEWRGQQCSSRASFHGLQQHKDFKSNSTATIVIGKQKTSQKQGCVFPVL